jgi:chromosome segregation ATPase
MTKTLGVSNVYFMKDFKRKGTRGSEATLETREIRVRGSHPGGHDGGDGGGYYPDLPQRVAALEANYNNVKDKLTEIKDLFKEFKDDINRGFEKEEKKRSNELTKLEGKIENLAEEVRKASSDTQNNNNKETQQKPFYKTEAFYTRLGVVVAVVGTAIAGFSGTETMINNRISTSEKTRMAQHKTIVTSIKHVEDDVKELKGNIKELDNKVDELNSRPKSP